MKVHTFESKIWLPHPIDGIFLFFADALNLERITPPFLKFTVISPTPITMARGARIRYRLRLRGTAIADHVEYSVWGGPIVNALFVQRDMRAIFNYRSRTLSELFAVAKHA
jgi:hypothetical protein